MNIIALFT